MQFRLRWHTTREQTETYKHTECLITYRDLGGVEDYAQTNESGKPTEIKTNAILFLQNILLFWEKSFFPIDK